MSRPSGDRFIARRVFMSIGIARSPSRRYEQRAQRKNTSGVTCSSFNHVGRSVARRLGSDEVIDVLADDEYTRECLAIRVARRLGSDEVIDVWQGHPWDSGPCAL